MVEHAQEAIGFIDIMLTSFLLGTVLLILTTSSRQAQVGAFLSLGAVLSVVWLRLGSVDIALAEAALGGGLLSGILVWLAVADPVAPAHSEEEQAPDSPQWLKGVTGVLGGAGIALVLGSVVLRAEQVTPSWSAALADGMASTGVDHEITAVLLGFRAYDTLLESAVLLFAGVIALALCASGAPAPATKQPAEMVLPSGHAVSSIPSIFYWFVRISAPVLLMLGLWILFAGSSDSGGAFQSGAVFAGLLILLKLAGIQLPVLTKLLVPMLVIGVIVFIIMAILGPLAGEAWLALVGQQPFLFVFTIEVFLTVGITSGLYLLYLTLENPGHLITTTEEVHP